MSILTNDTQACERAVTALFKVIDPELDLNIVDLGLIYRVDFYEARTEITVTMTLTTQFCPMGESIVDATTQAMQQAFPEAGIKIKLTFEPPWHTDMISEAGLTYLNS